MRAEGEHAYDVLMAAAGWGELVPGESFTVEQLCADFGLGRDGVLDAARQLTHDGVLSESDVESWVVRTPTRQDLRDIVELRALVEVPLLRRVVEHGVSATDLGSLGALANANSVAAAAGELLDYVRTDMAFHLQLLTISGNVPAVDLVRVLRVRCRIGGLRDDAASRFMTANAAEHHLLLELVADGRTNAAAELLHHHIVRIRDEWFGVPAVADVGEPAALGDRSEATS